jgi:uncharacterized protein YkwD
VGATPIATHRGPIFVPRRAIRHLLLAASIAASLLATTAAVPVAADNGGQAFVTAASTYRTNRGLPPVAAHAVIDRITAERTAHLVANDELGHDMAYVMRRFGEEGICWTRVGEIVAFNWSGQVSDFIDQWHNSDGHRAVMQRASFNVAGGRAMQGRDGRWYAAMIFVEYCGGSSPTKTTTSTGGFTDVGASAFRSEIAWLSAEEITGGCTASRFCPTAAVTREQMASFLTRATTMPQASRDWFRDDGASMHEGSINRIATASVAAGCTTVKYCPSSRVTREQMASFLARALDLPPATRDWFRDDEGSVHEGAINRLADAGITGGCASGRFCPGSAVTREQMAGFLYRAFGP